MIIKSLSVRNFRNIASAEFCFHPEVNILTGNNAQGKTNLCEAISICLGKSFKKQKYMEFPPFGCNKDTETAVELCFRFDELDKDNVILYTQKNGVYSIKFNGLKMAQAQELYGALRYVSFIPEDLSIVKGGPDLRRDYMDYVANMLNRVHNSKVYEYERALRQKNNVLMKYELMNRQYADSVIDVWNETLAKLGVNVMCGRLKYFEDLEKYAKEYYSLLNQNNEILTVEYESTIMDGKSYSFRDVDFMYETYLKSLRDSSERELDMKYTVVGVHRDDILFSINGMPSKKFASQGQIRSVAIALKLAEAKMIYERSNDYPIMILDDILSELDSFRRGFIINHIEKLQTFITSCNISDIENISDGKVWRVENGKFEVC